MLLIKETKHFWYFRGKNLTGRKWEKWLPKTKWIKSLLCQHASLFTADLKQFHSFHSSPKVPLIWGKKKSSYQKRHCLALSHCRVPAWGQLHHFNKQFAGNLKEKNSKWLDVLSFGSYLKKTTFYLLNWISQIFWHHLLYFCLWFQTKLPQKAINKM